MSKIKIRYDGEGNIETIVHDGATILNRCVDDTEFMPFATGNNSFWTESVKIYMDSILMFLSENGSWSSRDVDLLYENIKPIRDNEYENDNLGQIIAFLFDKERVRGVKNMLHLDCLRNLLKLGCMAQEGKGGFVLDEVFVSWSKVHPYSHAWKKYEKFLQLNYETRYHVAKLCYIKIT